MDFEDRWLLWRRDGGRCVYCGAYVPFDAALVDRRVPVSLGGTDQPTNLACCCAVCAREKGPRTEDEFRALRLLWLVRSRTAYGQAGSRT